MKFDQIPLPEKLERLDSMLNKLNHYKKEDLSTATATAIWREKLTFFITFVERMKQQLHISKNIEL